MQAKQRTEGSGICVRRLHFFAFAVAAGMALGAFGPASAVQAVGIKIPPSGDLIPAPFGYEAITGLYIAAHATPVFISPYVWAGKVHDAQLQKNQPVQILAKVRDYDWLLVGVNGIPLGYVPLAAVSGVK
jgi:hypothetical protein